MIKSAQLISQTETTFNKPILIIDKQGTIALSLIAKLKEFAQIVYVGKTNGISDKNLITLSYSRLIPKIPDFTYSQIFFVWNEQKDTQSVLKQCLNKAQTDHAQFLLIIASDTVSKKIIDEVIDFSSRNTVVIYGDVFGENAFLANNYLNQTILHAVDYDKILLSKTGLRQIYPIYFEDLILGILRLTFSSGKHIRVQYFMPKNPLTEFAVAHLLQKINPLIAINFTTKSVIKNDFNNLPEGQYFLGENYSIDEKIKNYYKEKLGKKLLEKKEVSSISSSFKYPSFLKKSNKFITKILWFLGTLLLLPFLVTIFLGFMGYLMFNNIQQAVENNRFDLALNYIQSAKIFFQGADTTSKLLLWEGNLLGQKDSIVENINKLLLVNRGVQLAENAFLTEKNLTQVLLSGIDKNQDNLLSIPMLFDGVAIGIQKLSLTASLPAKFLALQKQYQPFISLATGIDKTIPELLKGQKSYLILFQNNTELRPGGGFIGSYGKLSLDNGKFTDFTIHDVYEADGKLKGDIAPPFAIRRYLKSPHWFLRDSNFDVDFTKNASMAAFFLNQETGEKIDGVIGVDLSLVKKIVFALGSVSVPLYTETVTGDNLFLLTQKHAEKNFFPGSTQKKDFLSALFLALKDKLQNDKKVSYLKLIQALHEGVSQKHVLFAFANSSLQDIYTASGLSSSLWDMRNTLQNTILDFLGISEANLGGNKVNYYIQRNVSHQINVDEKGKLQEKLTIVYKNTSNGDWPGGDYQNYLRLILPLNTQISNIEIDGIDQKIIPAITDSKVFEDKKFVASNDLELETATEEGKVIFGFPIIIPKTSQKIVRVSYSLSQVVDLTQITFNYNLKIFKQPGIESFPFSFSIASPKGYMGTNLLSGFRLDKRKVIGDFNIVEDKNFNLEFDKN